MAWFCKKNHVQFGKEGGKFKKISHIFRPIFLLSYNVHTLGLKMFGTGGLFMKYNAYVPEGGNEGGRIAIPTSITFFNYYDMKSL